MSKKKETWFFGPGEEVFYSAHQGETLAFKLTDGEILEAVLVGVDAYHVVVQRRDGVTVLLPKHSILYALTRASIPQTDEQET